MPLIVVLGDKGAGKSSFISKIAEFNSQGCFKLSYRDTNKDRLLEFDFTENNTE